MFVVVFVVAVAVATCRAEPTTSQANKNRLQSRQNAKVELGQQAKTQQQHQQRRQLRTPAVTLAAGAAWLRLGIMSDKLPKSAWGACLRGSSRSKHSEGEREREGDSCTCAYYMQARVCCLSLLFCFSNQKCSDINQANIGRPAKQSPLLAQSINMQLQQQQQQIIASLSFSFSLSVSPCTCKFAWITSWLVDVAFSMQMSTFLCTPLSLLPPLARLYHLC